MKEKIRQNKLYFSCEGSVSSGFCKTQDLTFQGPGPPQELPGNIYWKKHFDSLLNQKLLIDDYIYKVSHATLRHIMAPGCYQPSSFRRLSNRWRVTKCQKYSSLIRKRGRLREVLGTTFRGTRWGEQFSWLGMRSKTGLISKGFMFLKLFINWQKSASWVYFYIWGIFSRMFWILCLLSTYYMPVCA